MRRPAGPVRSRRCWPPSGRRPVDHPHRWPRPPAASAAPSARRRPTRPNGRRLRACPLRWPRRGTYQPARPPAARASSSFGACPHRRCAPCRAWPPRSLRASFPRLRACPHRSVHRWRHQLHRRPTGGPPRPGRIRGPPGACPHRPPRTREPRRACPRRGSPRACPPGSSRGWRRWALRDRLGTRRYPMPPRRHRLTRPVVARRIALDRVRRRLPSRCRVAPGPFRGARLHRRGDSLRQPRPRDRLQQFPRDKLRSPGDRLKHPGDSLRQNPGDSLRQP